MNERACESFGHIGKDCIGVGNDCIKVEEYCIPCSIKWLVIQVQSLTAKLAPPVDEDDQS